MKLLIIVVIGFLICSLVVGVYSFVEEPQKDFFEENNIIDTSPIGKDSKGLWIYQTEDNQIIKTEEYPTTPNGIAYAKLTGVKE